MTKALYATPALLMMAAACSMVCPASASAQTGGDPYAGLPASLNLTGVVRDFKEVSAAGGHADFERDPTSGFAVYQQEVQDTLDSEGKPVFKTTGRKISSDYKDAAGRPIICPKPYIAPKSGDVAGSMASTDGGATTTAARFAQWYRDVPGVNLSKTLTVRLNRIANTNTYSFNDRTDPVYMNKGGFFPINGELLGNSGGSTPNQNFHFTFELTTSFQYKHGTGQVFSFTGDDDVFVFIDGKLVIDIGGIHSAANQSIELDRLTWLQDNHNYELKFFSAERHRTQSNCRIDTNLVLRTVDPPAVSSMFD